MKKAWMEYATGKVRELKQEHVLEVLPDESELAGRLIAASPMSIELVEPSRNPPPRMVYYLVGSKEQMSALIEKMYENGIEPYTAEVTPPLEEGLKHEYDMTPHDAKLVLTDFDFRFSHTDGNDDVWVDRIHGELSVFVNKSGGWSLFDNPDGVGDALATGANPASLEDALAEYT